MSCFFIGWNDSTLTLGVHLTEVVTDNCRAHENFSIVPKLSNVTMEFLPLITLKRKRIDDRIIFAHEICHRTFLSEQALDMIDEIVNFFLQS